MSNDTIFADGLKFFEKHHDAPDFVIGTISIMPKQFVDWLRANHKAMDEKGYIKLQVLMGKKGYPYVKLDTYKKEDNRGDF